MSETCTAGLAGTAERGRRIAAAGHAPRARFGESVAFAGCAGFYHAADGPIGVVLVSAWGFEAICLARGWRGFAEDLAAAGFPTLRYDHPGTGDSLDGEPTLGDWRRAVADAAAFLRRAVGTRRIILIGHGIGALLAAEAATLVEGLHGIVALAPVASGRLYLREVAASAAMVGGAVPERVSIAGLEMPPGVAREMGTARFPATLPMLALAMTVRRPGRKGDEDVAGALAAAAERSSVLDYLGLEAALTDPTRAVPPAATYADVIARLQAEADMLDRPPPTPPAAAPDASLSGPGFVETPVRFGPGGRLFGVLCRPEPDIAGRSVVLFVNSGRDGHAGWARIAVDHARRLASAGIPSFRMDLSGLGESGTLPEDEGRELLYSERHRQDVLAAIDHLVGAGHPSVVVSGRCSGAYAGLHAAAAHPAVSALVLVNLLRIVWDPAETVEAALVADVRSAAVLKERARDPAVLKRLLTGGIALGPLARRVAARAMQRLPRPPWSPAAARRRRALALFAGLATRGTRVALLSSAGDASLDTIAAVFGSLGAVSAGAPSRSLTILDGADHNLNQPAARDEVFSTILKILGENCGICGGCKDSAKRDLR